ncbi:pilin [Patescibacteria group bacterium]
MKKLLLIIGLIVLTSFNLNAAFADDDIDSSPYYGEEGDPDFGPQEEEGELSEIEKDELIDELMDDFERENEEAKSLKGTTFNVGDVLTLDEGDQETTYFDTEEGESPISKFIVGIIEFATRVIGTLAIILFIVAGFMFMLSQGNEQRLSDAKEVIKYAVIGLSITFLSYVIAIFIQSLFNR